MTHKGPVSEPPIASGPGPRVARAAKACLACRARKVRCDASKTSQPCTNCRLNSQKCLVVSRASRLSTLSWQRQRSQRKVRNQPAVLEEPGSGADCNPEARRESCNSDDDPKFPSPNVQPSPVSYDEESSAARRPAARPMVLYSHFPFLAMNNIHMIAAEELNFLELQGCLHFPIERFMNDFVQQYFLYVHPFMPLIDEGEFWEMYHGNGTQATERSTISLLVFQTMLFSSCTFVPMTTIRRLGYPDLLSARAAFYRKAKLLYDMNTEASPLHLAQAALLLMSWIPPDNLFLNPFRTWLGLAIQHARSINADCLMNSTESPTDATIHHEINSQTLRRLWWCCIIADRISPLCAHYDHQITRDNYNFEISRPLDSTDLGNEIFRSCVYPALTKKRLLEIFETFLDLLVIWTDILPLVARHQDSMRSRRTLEPSESTKFQAAQCEKRLESWFSKAMDTCPPFDETNAAGSSDKNGVSELDKSVVFHTNLLYIYHHYAKASLVNYRLQIHVSLASIQEMDTSIYSDEVSRLRQELQDSTSSTTSLLGLLVQRRLARWLPAGILACVAMPLALQAVNLRLNTSNRDHEAGQLKGANTKLKAMLALQETMKLLSPQYNGVGLIEEAAEQVAQLAQKMSAVTATSAWPELLARSPSQYLQIVLVVDCCISKGQVDGQQSKRTWVKSGVSEQSHGSEPVEHSTLSARVTEAGAQTREAAPVRHQSFASWQGSIQAGFEDGAATTMPFGLIAAGSCVD